MCAFFQSVASSASRLGAAAQNEVSLVIPAQGICVSGDALRCTVVLKLKERRSIRKIVVRAFGRQFVKFSNESKDKFQDMEQSGTLEVPMSARFSTEDGQAVLNPGTYRFPYVLEIPANVPSTANFDFGFIKHEVEVYVYSNSRSEAAGFFNLGTGGGEGADDRLHDRKELFVLERCPLSAYDAFYVPSVSKLVSGPESLCAMASCDRNVLFPQETVPVRLQYYNDGSVTSVHVEFIRSTRLSAGIENDSKDSVVVEKRFVPSNAQEVYMLCEIPLPISLSPSILDRILISVKYFFRVTLYRSNGENVVLKVKSLIYHPVCCRQILPPDFPVPRMPYEDILEGKVEEVEPEIVEENPMAGKSSSVLAPSIVLDYSKSAPPAQSSDSSITSSFLNLSLSSKETTPSSVNNVSSFVSTGLSASSSSMIEEEEKEEEETSAPPSGPPPADEEVVVNVSAIVESEGHVDTPSSPSPQAVENLPSHIEKKFDPSSGRYYYVDHVAKSTSWTLPESATSSSTSAPVTSFPTVSVSSVSSSSVPSAPDSGSSLFWNRGGSSNASGNPASASQFVSSFVSSVSAGGAQSGSVPQGFVPQGYVPAVSSAQAYVPQAPSSGGYAYVNPQQSVYQNAYAQQQQYYPQTTTSYSAYGSYQASNTGVNPWVQYADEYGRPYWYNTMTGATSWNYPY